MASYYGLSLKQPMQKYAEILYAAELLMLCTL